MSSITRAGDFNRHRVVIPAVKKLPPNPHICSGPLATIRERALGSPSETGQTYSEFPPEPREVKGLRQQLLIYDQRSFLTGSAVPDLQAAHIITAIRNDPNRKQAVEVFLTQQGVAYGVVPFVLDHPNNAILLEASLHAQWDLYGTYCFVPAKADANAILKALRKSNKRWQEFPEHDRPLDVTEAPFRDPSWDVIVLHPHAMLPERLPLAIAENRTFYRYPLPLPASTVDWTWWVTSKDCLIQAAAPDAPLPPFKAMDMRQGYLIAPISSLAMIVNASCKLAQFMKEHGSSATPRVQDFAALMEDLVEEIFFVPDGFTTVAHVSGSPEVQQVPNEDERIPDENLSHMERGTGQSLNPGHGFWVNTASGLGPMEAPEEPNPDDGLTDSEFRLVSAQARDPSLGRKERASAAMMMLFGTRRFKDPYIDRMQAIDEPDVRVND